MISTQAFADGYDNVNKCTLGLSTCATHLRNSGSNYWERLRFRFPDLCQEPVFGKVSRLRLKGAIQTLFRDLCKESNQPIDSC